MTFEEELARFFRRFGPFVAIGRPDEALPPAGAARLYVGSGDWQQVTLDLIDRSQIVVWQAGETEGAWWELRQLVERLEPRQLLLVIPNPQAAPERYESLRRRAAAVLPESLPESTAKANFVMFDGDWRPEIILNDAKPALLRWLTIATLDLDATLWAFMTRHPRPERPATLSHQRLFSYVVGGIYVALAAAVLVVAIVGAIEKVREQRAAALPAMLPATAHAEAQRAPRLLREGRLQPAMAAYAASGQYCEAAHEQIYDGRRVSELCDEWRASFAAALSERWSELLRQMADGVLATSAVQGIVESVGDDQQKKDLANAVAAEMRQLVAGHYLVTFDSQPKDLRIVDSTSQELRDEMVALRAGCPRVRSR